MSFKVKIEIGAFDGMCCGYCRFSQGINEDICVVFQKILVYDLMSADYYRCQKCLEAEKKYKEKENETQN